MNYVEARQLLDKQPLPVRPQQAVNALIRFIDRTQEAIERFGDAYDGEDERVEVHAIEDLRLLAEVLKKGREGAGA